MKFKYLIVLPFMLSGIVYADAIANFLKIGNF